jgi:hypothetical protein
MPLILTFVKYNEIKLITFQGKKINFDTMYLDCVINSRKFNVKADLKFKNNYW